MYERAWLERLGVKVCHTVNFDTQPEDAVIAD